MNDEDSVQPTGGGCMLSVIVLVIAGLFGLVLAAAMLDGGSNGGLLNDNRRTSTTNNTIELDVFSNNSVEIFSPDTYVNTGDTDTRINGDRNQVQPAGGCWLSSQQAWGACPAWAPEGSAVP